MKRLKYAAVCLTVFTVAALAAFNILDRVFSQKEFSSGSYDGYYYLALDETEKQAYTAVKEEIYTFPEKIETPVLTKSQLEDVLNALVCDDPMMFMLSTCKLTTQGSRAFFTPDYTMGIEEYTRYADRIKTLTESINNAVSGKSEYDKALFCHDYIVNNCDYSDTDSTRESSVIGVFIDSKAKCSGYAKAYKLLLDSIGTESVLITGTATDREGNSLSHMWNAVRFGDSWCYTDPTWNDPITEEGKRLCRHVYFNMTEDMLRRTHSDFSFSQSCNDPSLYYYIIHNAYFESCGESFLPAVSDLIKKAATEGSDRIEIMFSDGKTMADAFELLFEKERIYRALETAALETALPLVTDSVKYAADKDDNLITIIFETEE